MGYFSWITMDTNESIPNGSSSRTTFKVHMLDNKGNVWTESMYEGYGVFGGKDFYELLAEMNGLTPCTRERGIDYAFKENPIGDHTPNVKYPNLVRYLEGWEYNPAGPESCPDQGYFYSEEDDIEWDC